jgi:transketolase
MKTSESKKVELRDAYGEALVKLGQKDERVVVLDADVSHHARTHHFAQQFPDRFFELGVAEQNMMGVAAGLATCGLVPFTTCFAVFAAKRAHDQVSISIAYPNLSVKVVGSYSGLSTPNTGATHQAIDDIASMRAMPNMRVVVPGDAIEVERAVFALAQEDGPFYLRIARSPAMPAIFGEAYQFELGKAVVLREGSDVTLMGTGIMTSRCLEAAELLEKHRIGATVLHVPTVKPLDGARVMEAAEKTGAVVTVENHSIIGGLGSAVSEVLGENRICPIQRVGIMDTFCESAESEEALFMKYGLTGEAIVRAAKKVMERK